MNTVVCGADFETDTDGSKAWVVQWCIYQDESNCWTGRDIKSFKDKVIELLSINKRTIIYFHNIKYDIQFFKYALKEIEDDAIVMVEYLFRRGTPLSIQLTYDNHVLSFRDSLKKMQGNLKSMGKTIGLPKLEGFDFYPGWSLSVDFNDANNWKYIIRDAEIVGKAMQSLHNRGYSSLTLSGDAIKAAVENIGGEEWFKIFPKLDVNLDKVLRGAYTGGLNISQHKGYCDGPILHADVHSMYPSVIAYDELPIGYPRLSFTKPESGLYIVRGVFKLKLRRDANGLAWFTFKSIADNAMEGLDFGEPVIETKEWHNMTLSSVDYDILKFWYNIEHNPEIREEYYCFDSRVGILKEHIENLYTLKDSVKQSDKVLYRQYKGLMNNLYGRLGMTPVITDTTLEMDARFNDLRFKETMSNSDAIRYSYLPMAIFITSHARRRLLDYVWKAGPENVIHCDTDSVIHFAPNGLVEGIEYDDNKLGTWGIESHVKWMYEGGPKRYFEKISDGEGLDTIHMACCGLSQNLDDNDKPIGCWIEILDDPEKISIDGTLIGHVDYEIQSDWLKKLVGKSKVNTMKLVQKQIPGGCKLEETTYEINANNYLIGRVSG